MSFPSQAEVQVPLLQEIEAMGGQAKPNQSLLLRVARHFPQISEADLQEKKKDGANRWCNWVAFSRLQLVHKGELDGAQRGIWKITEKGRKRLGIVPPPPPPPPPNAPDKLAEEINKLLGKLVELAKKAEGEEPLPSHDELVQRVKEMGEKLGKVVEVKWGPVYKHDCVWKDNPYANPKLVMEVCDKGNLDKDIASLLWAVKNWGANSILVIFDESDFHAAQRKLAHEKQVCPVKADDLLKVHSLLQAGYIQVIKSIFDI